MNSDILARRKSEILAAAEKVFDSAGYAATTMEAVAERAGISKGNIYNYFRSKQDLFTQVFSERVAGGHRELERLIGSNLPASTKMDAIIDQWFSRLPDHQRIGRLMLEFWATAARESHDGELMAAFRRMYDGFRSRLAQVVEQGFREGLFHTNASAHVAASLIAAVVDGIIVQSVLGVTDIDQGFLSWMKRAIFLGLTDDPAAAKTEITQCQQ